MRALGLLALIAVAALAVLSLVGRGFRPGTPARSANVRFGVGAALLLVAFALSVADAGRIAIGACYIGGLALLVNGYLEGRFTRRR